MRAQISAADARTRSGGHDLEWKTLESTYEDARGVSWRIIRSQGKVLRARQQFFDDHACFETSDGCTDTEVVTPAEAHVVLGMPTVETQGVGIFEHGNIAVRRGP